jgi:hypothetical protein
MSIKMDLKCIGCEAVEWNQVVQDSVQWQYFENTMMNPCVPQTMKNMVS